jgi:hypothetical protein
MGLASIALMSALSSSAAAQPPRIPSCEAFQARLINTSPQTEKGRRPEFTLLVRNTGRRDITFLDTRGGRRGDLSDSYYELVVLTAAGELPHVPRAISDPGPISKDDSFVLAPGASSELPVTSPLGLERLPVGKYRAHVVVTTPSDGWARCTSRSAEFSVTEERSPTR